MSQREPGADELLAAYAHDRASLTPEEQRRVELYLSVSSDARREVEAMRGAIERVRASEDGREEPVWNDLARAIGRAVDHAAAEREREAGTLRGWLRGLWRPRYALAVVAVAAAAVILAVWRSRSDGERDVAVIPRDVDAGPGPEELRDEPPRDEPLRDDERAVVELDDVDEEVALAALEDEELRGVVDGLRAGLDGVELGDDPEEEDLGGLVAAPVLEDGDVAALLGEDDDGEPRYVGGAHLDMFAELDYDDLLADLDDAELDALDALLAAIPIPG